MLLPLLYDTVCVVLFKTKYPDPEKSVSGQPNSQRNSYHTTDEKSTPHCTTVKYYIRINIP